MTSRPPLRKTEDYDDSGDRWLDDADGGDRWRAYGSCVGAQDPDLFFPVTINANVITDDDEPPYPSPEVKAICDRCPVRAVCLTRNINEPFGIFGGTTGFQRGLMTRKINRKVCPSCRSEDVVDKAVHHEICLACGVSWEVL